MRFVRRWLVAMLTLGAVTLLPAQAEGQAALGLSAGVSFADFSGDDVEDTDMRTGLLGGAYVSFPLGDIFSIAPGVYYVQKGTKPERIEGAAVDATLKLDYIEVPVLGVFTVTAEGRPVGVSLFLGPSIAFEISCNIEGEVGNVEFSGECDDPEFDDEAGDRKKTDFGAIFGAGLSFAVSEGLDLTVSGGLDMGLTSLDDSPEENDVKNSVWFLTAGVRFPLGG